MGFHIKKTKKRLDHLNTKLDWDSDSRCIWMSRARTTVIWIALLPETPEELSKGLDENKVCKIVKFYKWFEDSFVEIALLAQVVANGGLVQALALVQEGSYILGSFLDQSVLKLKENGAV